MKYEDLMLLVQQYNDNLIRVRDLGAGTALAGYGTGTLSY